MEKLAEISPAVSEALGLYQGRKQDRGQLGVGLKGSAKDIAESASSICGIPNRVAPAFPGATRNRFFVATRKKGTWQSSAASNITTSP
jgi:hypothetical protein